jgi:hypothetical protein
MKPQLITLIIVLFFTTNRALGQQDVLNDPDDVAENWIVQYELLNDSTLKIPDRTITKKQAIKASQKIKSNLGKAVSKYKNSDKSAAYQHQLSISNTNASLWYKNVQSADFQRLLKKLVTGTQMSPDHIHSLRDAYHKWIISPTIKNLISYSEELALTGRSYEILCRMSFENVPDNAIIKYADITSDSEKSLDRIHSEKVVPVGNYYVWLENDGGVITDKSHANYCITNNQNIDFQTLR